MTSLYDHPAQRWETDGPWKRDALETTDRQTDHRWICGMARIMPTWIGGGSCVLLGDRPAHKVLFKCRFVQAVCQLFVTGDIYVHLVLLDRYLSVYIGMYECAYMCMCCIQVVHECHIGVLQV